MPRLKKKTQKKKRKERERERTVRGKYNSIEKRHDHYKYTLKIFELREKVA